MLPSRDPAKGRLRRGGTALPMANIVFRRRRAEASVFGGHRGDPGSARVDQLHVVVRDAAVGRDDRQLLGTSLRDEQPVERITMMHR